MRESTDNNERKVLSNFEDVRDAAVEAAGTAKRSIAIYTPDLEPGIYDYGPFLEAVKRLVLAKRYARVRVLISDPARTIRNGNKLVSLGRRLNTYIDFRNVHDDYREEHHEAYLIADENAVLYRADAGKWQGISGLHEPAIARKHLEVFEKIWEASEYRHDLRALHI